MRESDANIATRREHLPPEVKAARKTRINNELVEVFRRPCPVDATPSIQGIGLYTHIAGLPAMHPQFPHQKYTEKGSNPIFLPIGGPEGMNKEGDVHEASISDDVERAWKAVQQAVDKEGEHVAQTDLDIGSLKERYGALDEKMYAQLMPQPQPAVLQSMNRYHNADVTAVPRIAGGVNQLSNRKRLSVGDGLARDMSMIEGGEERHGSTSVAWTGNDYEAARDPRLRAR